MPTIDGLSYSRRKAITISHANVPSTLSNFPLCVQINGDADLGSVCRTDGTDLRFTDAGGNLLDAQEESFAVVSGAATGLFWVGVPSISAAADTTIYCYYGNPQGYTQSGSTNVWDAHFHGIWHLNDRDTRFRDSTGNGNISDSTTNFPTPVTGQLGGAQSFVRSLADQISIPDSPSLGTTTYFSISAWINLSTIPLTRQYYAIASKQLADGTASNYDLLVSGQGYGLVQYYANSVWQQCSTAGTVFSNPGTWYYVCGVFDGDFLRFYVNGVQTAFFAPTAAPAVQAAPLTIGIRNDGSYAMNGMIDELRFSDIARSGDWIRFEYYNQKDSAGQLTWGPQQMFATAIRPLLDGSLASDPPLLGACS